MTPPPRRVLLGVGGGIAAYKAVELLRLLTESGHDVVVVPTQSALRFVGTATWAALSHHPVTTQVWSGAEDVPHVRLGREADLVVVAPATADLVARTAHGLADDLLTNSLLTGADSGTGRLPEPPEIAQLAELLLLRPDALPADLVGRHVVVSAGGTREAIDPVRFLGNASSGRQGHVLALVAAARGATVTLVTANTTQPDPSGGTVVHVRSTQELRDAVRKASHDAEVVVMAAAVADFRPATTAEHKMKKSELDPEPIPVVRNPDILAELVAARRPGQLLVGFAAETGDESGDVLAHGRAKLARKGCDLLVVNDVGGGRAFGRPDNAAVILDSAGGEVPVARGPKAVLAAAVWDAVSARLARPSHAREPTASR